MTTPFLCIECETVPVKPVKQWVKRWHGAYRTDEHGVKWRDFCGVPCSARYNGHGHKGTNKPSKLAYERSRISNIARTKQRLLEEAAPFAQKWNVPIREVLKLKWDSESRGYNRGYEVAWKRSMKPAKTWDTLHDAPRQDDRLAIEATARRA